MGQYIDPSLGTKIADIIVPAVFNPYVIQRSVELDTFIQSGIATNNPELDRLASTGGKLINMPYFTDIDGEDEVLSDVKALTPDKIGTGQDVAALYMRGKSWAVNDLAKSLSGADPMGAIGSLVAQYWVRRRQELLFNILGGVFSADNAANKLDISGKTGDAALINASTFIDALQQLGDARFKITGVGMHSAVVSYLAKLDLVTTIINPSNQQAMISYFMRNANGTGYQIFETDKMPNAAGVYTTYLFGQGAIGVGNGSAPVPTETDRDTLLGEDILINRSHFLYHVRGVKFTGASVAGSSPTNAEAAMAANYSWVYDPKNIRVIQFKHKIG
jgi:hypothetical protein